MVSDTTTKDARVVAVNPRRRRTWLFGTTVVLLISASVPYFAQRWGGMGLVRQDDRQASTIASFELDLTDQFRVDPKLIRYALAGTIDLTLDVPRAIASGPADRLYVAGDRAVHIIDSTSQRREVIELTHEPTCLAIGGAEHADPGRIYVGTTGGVEVFGASHEPLATWKLPTEQSELTAIAVSDHDVFVADAGQRVVWRYLPNGELKGQLGQPDPARGVPGFVIPSSYFDIAVGPAELIHVVNPGRLQIATFSFDGDLGSTWGEPSSLLDGFFGCCNPAHIALLPDGRFVTSEKGIPRIKIYSPTGDFVAVVAGPEQLGVRLGSVGDPRSTHEEHVFDIAVDSRGRVLALDTNDKQVRIFHAIDDPASPNP